MPVRYDNSRQIGDCRAIVVENESLRLTVLPELGAKIYDIIHKDTGRNLLWHNPRVQPRKVPFGSRFDDVWSGGWDEIFPNDAESLVGPERYPDMGEAWALPWDYEIEETDGAVTLTTTVKTPITPAEIKRRLTLEGREPGFTVQYEIRNLSPNEIRFLWKIHPAFEINEECKIDIPAGRALIDRRYARYFSQAQYSWPLVRSKSGMTVDISEVDPARNDCTLHYVTDLREGVFRFVDKKNGIVSTLRFDRSIMNNVWLFLAYGGWRGHYTAVIEPSTSYPYDLATAIRQGHCATLRGGETLSTMVEFGVDTVAKTRTRAERKEKD